LGAFGAVGDVLVLRACQGAPALQTRSNRREDPHFADAIQKSPDRVKSPRGKNPWRCRWNCLTIRVERAPGGFPPWATDW